MTGFRRSLRAILMAAVAIAAAPAPPLRDPLLKLPFDPAAVRFAPAPADLARRCPALLSRNYGHRMWLFAGGDTGLMIVGGLFTAQAPGLADVIDDHGTMLRLTRGGCTMIGPAASPFRDPASYAADVSAAELRALARDAAERYITAFGPTRLCAAIGARPAAFARLAALRLAFRARARCPVRR